LRPATALVVALQKRGREALFVTPDYDRAYLEAAGIDVERNWRGVELPYDPAYVWAKSRKSILTKEELARVDASFAKCTQNARETAVEILRSGEDFAAIVGPAPSIPFFILPAIARRLPFFLAGVAPCAPSSEYLLWSKSPRGRFRGWENRVKLALGLWWVSRWFVKSDLAAPIRAVLEPARFKPRALVRFYRKEMYHLAGISPAVFPRPRDWTSRMYLTGYAYPDCADDGQPPSDLEAFLKAGPRPVHVGFGSYELFSGPAGRELLESILDVIVKVGKRAVVQVDPEEADLTKYGERVFAVKEVPHSWLFPRCEAVLHHCGGGTFHSVLKAGRPMICYPFGGDQVFWAHRAAELGVAPPYCGGVFEIEAERLEQNLHFVERPEVGQKAGAIAQQMAGEPNGADIQAEIICRVLDGPGNSRGPVSGGGS
jgi:UDP:flavonoid glycosyltransferase YjiC (YdhE family)